MTLPKASSGFAEAAASRVAPRVSPSPAAPTGTGAAAGCLAHHGAGGEGVVAAGVEQDDRDRDDFLQRGEVVRDRHQALAGGIEGRQVGVDGNEVVLAAGLDAMSRIVDDGDVGALGVLGEAFEGAAQLAGVGIAGVDRVEAEPVEEILDGAGVALGIGERRKVLVGRLADDEGHAAQRLRLLGADRVNGGDGENQGDEQRSPEARNCPIRTALAVHAHLHPESRRRIERRLVATR